uniref:centrosomal protein of 57 kDa-like isoform X2 n=1 Tax=Ciona intestinalis TaxID=7719 RepID=UPI000180D1BE|nr:centrosomal protein of 57 kDa-like isoform X2 [Ciona intestinalis]|eukprot:XP_026690584.1 centrosomal protein of 57 kDa-like isoform X2 [Ciona intestinalis]
MATSLFDEPPSIASFQDYPTTRPFINSNLRRSPGKPVKAYPESSSKAVLSALKGLQDKIYNLELDRSKAEKNLKHLAAETSLYKDLLSKSQQSSPVSKPAASFTPTQPVYSPTVPARERNTIEVESQLRNADTRCRLLERQLENMRRMVQCAEKERSDALERQVALERERGRVTAENREAQAKLEQLQKLEHRFEDLASRKNKSEVKVKELEEKLKLEEHQRKLLCDKAAQFQTEAEKNRILYQHEIPERDTNTKPKKKSTKKKKKANANGVKTKKPAVVKRPAKSAGQPHYRLNLADVPFIAGTSTSPSHAVSANFQRLLHDLKHHSPLYCNDNVVSERKISTGSSTTEEEDTRGRQRVHQSSVEEDDLTDLLVALQDEFGKMTFEHQVLAKQITSTQDRQTKREFELEMENLVSRMERKGEQISTVRRHRAQLSENRRNNSGKGKHPTHGVRSTSDPRGFRRPRSANPTSVGNSPMAPRVPPGEMRKKRLAFLKEMKTVRSNLRKDDLSWD